MSTVLLPAASSGQADAVQRIKITDERDRLNALYLEPKCNAAWYLMRW